MKEVKSIQLFVRSIRNCSYYRERNFIHNKLGLLLSLPFPHKTEGKHLESMFVITTEKIIPLAISPQIV